MMILGGPEGGSGGCGPECGINMVVSMIGGGAVRRRRARLSWRLNWKYANGSTMTRPLTCFYVSDDEVIKRGNIPVYRVRPSCCPL